MPSSEIPPHDLRVDWRELHAELLDLETGAIWPTRASTTREAYGAPALPPPPRPIEAFGSP